MAVSVVVCASYNVIDGPPTPLAKVTEAGYDGAVPPGELDGPENATVFDPVYEVAVFPNASSAVIASLNATPAVGDAGVATRNELAVAGPTTIAPEATPANPSVVSLAVIVVVWASLSVTDAVAWPELNLAVAGYTGALPLGELAGPEKLRLLVPARVPGVFPQASCAVRVTLNAVPAVSVEVALAAI